MTKLHTLLLIALLACVFCSSCASHPTAAMDIEFPPGSVPAPYYTLQQGMSGAQVKVTLGAPAKIQINPRYEVKTDAQWEQIKSKYDIDRSAQLDPSAVADPQFTSLGKELEHRVKETWIYYPVTNTKLWAALSFDGQGKLITAGSGVMTEPPPGSSRS